MRCVVGQQFSAMLVDPAGIPRTLGARVEVPVTRSIASAWTAAVLSGSVWTVTLDSPPFPGDYCLVWQTSDYPPSFEAFCPLWAVNPTDVVNSGVDFPLITDGDVTPTVHDIALLERTRTVEEGSREALSFTADTRPSVHEVEMIIPQAVDAVIAELPYKTCDPQHYPQIKRAVALMTAILIEGSFFREQVPQGGASLWRTLYDVAMTGLSSRMQVDLKQANLLQRMEPTPMSIQEPYPFDTPYPFFVE